MADRYSFNPGDRVRGSFDSATVLRVDGEGRNAHVWIEWDEIDAAGNRRQPHERRSIRKAWTLTKLEACRAALAERDEPKCRCSLIDAGRGIDTNDCEVHG